MRRRSFVFNETFKLRYGTHHDTGTVFTLNAPPTSPHYCGAVLVLEDPPRMQCNLCPAFTCARRLLPTPAPCLRANVTAVMSAREPPVMGT